jgi:hypothetical protein
MTRLADSLPNPVLLTIVPARADAFFVLRRNLERSTLCSHNLRLAEQNVSSYRELRLHRIHEWHFSRFLCPEVRYDEWSL